MSEPNPSLRRAAALGRLATLYGRHVARRGAQGLVRSWSSHPAQTGLERFHALYGPDRITALTDAERAVLPAHGRCVACGLCGLATPRAGYLRPERLASQLTRSLPDLWVTRDLPLDGVDWAAAAAVCPTGVPLAEMRGFVRDRLERDGDQPPARRPSAPPPPPRPPLPPPWGGGGGG